MWSAAKNVELLAFKEFLHNMPPYDNTCLQSLVMPSELVALLFSVANIHPLNIHPPAQHENNQYSKWKMTKERSVIPNWLFFPLSQKTSPTDYYFCYYCMCCLHKGHNCFLMLNQNISKHTGSVDGESIATALQNIYSAMHLYGEMNTM